MKKKLTLFSSIVLKRMTIALVMMIILNTILRIQYQNFYLYFAWPLLLLIFLSFWFKESKKRWAILLSPIVLVLLLMLSAVITLIIYWSSPEPGWWIIKACISSIISSFIFTLYFFTIANDDTREDVKYWLNKNIIFYVVITIIQPFLWLNQNIRKLKEFTRIIIWTYKIKRKKLKNFIN